MRAIGAYFVAVASAVALAVFPLMADGIAGFESGTDHDLAQKIGDFLQVVGITYMTMFSVVLLIAALPFAVVLRLLRPRLSGLVAAGAAGCAAAALALFLLSVTAA